MTGLQDMTAKDIMAIKDDLVEPREFWGRVTSDMADKAVEISKGFTYFRNDKIVAICGAIRNGDVWTMWALYRKSASCRDRYRAMVAFVKRFRKLLSGGRARFGIASDIENGANYAKKLGGRYVRSEPSLLFDGKINDIYEVA